MILIFLGVIVAVALVILFAAGLSKRPQARGRSRRSSATSALLASGVYSFDDRHGDPGDATDADASGDAGDSGGGGGDGAGGGDGGGGGADGGGGGGGDGGGA